MKPKILIIDDEIHIVELIRFNLETSGYEVDIAYDGLDGYLKIKENAPQVVACGVIFCVANECNF